MVRKHGHVVASCPSGKRSYPDRTVARRAGRNAQWRGGIPFDVYRCTWLSVPGVPCGQYHLSTRLTKGREPIG